MDKYIGLSDSELRKLAADGDTLAEDALLGRYSSFVELCARPYYIVGGDDADLLQEGMFGLLSAIRSFRESQSVPFKAYAELCIRRRIISAIRSASRLKHTPLNEGVSLEETLSGRLRETNARIVPDQRRAPEEQVLARESAEEFYQSFTQHLSSFEREVFPLYLDGYSYRAIAERFGREEKAIDNAVQRIRRKLARILLSGDNSES